MISFSEVKPTTDRVRGSEEGREVRESSKSKYPEFVKWERLAYNELKRRQMTQSR